MTNDIKGVLITVEPSDPHGLLKTGPFGAQPPALMFGRWGSFDDDTAWWTTMSWSLFHTTRMSNDYEPSECIRFALVLAWDGKPVREGCYRAADAKCNSYTPSFVSASVACALLSVDDDEKYFERVLEMLSPLGKIVLIDAECREVKNA